VGIAARRLAGGVLMQAVVAVNAFGEVVDPRSGRIIAGARGPRGRIRPIDELLDIGAPVAPPLGNTTIGVVITNAALNKEEVNVLADVAHDGLAQTIRPTHTRVDGDTLFTLSTGTRARGVPMLDFIALQHAAVQVVVAAVLRAVRRATPIAGVPAIQRRTA
jgi:L-aminopeptidase/D-esterase-like protein